jgi:Protein of unknown function (DUF3363)
VFSPRLTGLVEAHVRRLEALRRAGIVERVEEGVWRVPADLPARGLDYDVRKADGPTIQVRSHLPLKEQVRALGATWLDYQLIRSESANSNHGFGGEVRQALTDRRAFLVEAGFAERRGQRVVLMRDLLATLRSREVATAATAVHAETGLAYRSIKDGQWVSGVFRRSIQLTSGRFAMLDDGTGFSLVPWKPVLEYREGQQLTAVVRGTFVSWDVGRRRGMSP